MTSAAELDAASAKLMALAEVVGTALDPVVAFHRPDVWQGARAGRFGQELDDQRARLRATALDLVDEARRLHAQADLLRITFGP
jgi:hypothetical protein